MSGMERCKEDQGLEDFGNQSMVMFTYLWSELVSGAIGKGWETKKKRELLLKVSSLEIKY